ncbi:MAG: hypothetical protein GY796_04375 [Chloroflexi bacterium]|nr:hypothetical protein [Chloroflexota bacterium]
MKTIRHILIIGALSALLLLVACNRSKNNTPIVGETSSGKLFIHITEDGLYQLTPAHFEEAGLETPTFTADNIHLSQNGTAVPILIQNNNLIFYGQAPDSRYVTTRPYLLKTGQAAEIMADTAVPATGSTQNIITQSRHLEDNLLYEAQALDIEHTDPWYWQKLRQGENVEIPFTLPPLTDGSGSLQITLWGVTHALDIEDDHDFELRVNGQAIDTIRWDGNTHYTANIPLPPGTLQAGENSITLDNGIPGAALLDIMQLNNLDLTFPTPAAAQTDQLIFSADQESAFTLSGFADAPLVLDVQDPTQPALLSGRYEDGQMFVDVAEGMQVTAVGPQGFLSPQSVTPMRQSDWHNSDNQADLLIITTDALAPALEPLVTARQEQGLSVAVVPTAEIYAEFGYGEASPTTINQFVTYAVENWQTPPQYLFLVGDATSDYRSYTHPLPENHLPSPMVPVQYSGETVSDSRLADIDGDMRPDLAVGRWPVNTPAEVESLVARTLAYEQSTAADNALFTTDGTEEQFGIIAQRIWQDSQIPDEAVTHLDGATIPEVTAAWNDGAWLTTYIGHGSLELWGKDDVFNSAAVSGLASDNPPIVVQLTCLTGLFAQPDVESLSEVMLKHENGPVLLVAATSLTLSTHQEPFATALLQNLNNQETERMGDAFQQAKLSLNLEHNIGLREISDTFVLLGDPSTIIIRPSATNNS